MSRMNDDTSAEPIVIDQRTENKKYLLIAIMRFRLKDYQNDTFID